MLAYVFWHWPESGVERAAYERGLLAFHASLVAAGASGVLDAVALRVGARPGDDAGLGEEPAYEDWYLVEDFAALGELNEVAVSGACKAPHDSVAHRAGGGAGGVYRAMAGSEPRSARVAFDAVRRAYWFAKPAGWTYARCADALAPAIAAPSVQLWQRQMVLGPAPEFCVIAPGALELPEAIEPCVVDVERLSSGPRPTPGPAVNPANAG